MNKFRRFFGGISAEYFGNKPPKLPKTGGDQTPCLRRLEASPSDPHWYLMTRKCARKHAHWTVYGWCRCL